MLLLAYVVVIARDAVGQPVERVWLFGGCSGRAYADNSAVLHAHMRRHHPSEQVYWVIERSSPDVKRAAEVGPVLFADSFQTYVLALAAKVHVVSHGVHDVPGCGSRLNARAVKVRLGHGLTALKRTKGSIFRSVKSRDRTFDLVPVASAFERDIKRTWGIHPDKLVITGLTRYDQLLRQHRALRNDDLPRRVLYLPTWRDWLPQKADEGRAQGFDDYVRAYIGHPKLVAVLRSHDVTLDVATHLAWRSELVGSSGLDDWQQVRFLSGGAALEAAIVDADLLVTDYSSIAWDFLFLDKPVLFYQFDLADYERHRGAHINLRRDLFGPTAYTADAAAQVTAQIIQSAFMVPEWRGRMQAWRDKVFAFNDSGNCNRVYDAIEQRLKPQELSRQAHTPRGSAGTPTTELGMG